MIRLAPSTFSFCWIDDRWVFIRPGFEIKRDLNDQLATWTNDASELGERLPIVGNVLEYVTANHRAELAIGKRHLRDVLLRRDIGSSEVGRYVSLTEERLDPNP